MQPDVDARRNRLRCDVIDYRLERIACYVPEVRFPGDDEAIDRVRGDQGVHHRVDARRPHGRVSVVRIVILRAEKDFHKESGRLHLPGGRDELRDRLSVAIARVRP